jgi:hypothetical protein
MAPTFLLSESRTPTAEHGRQVCQKMRWFAVHSRKSPLRTIKSRTTKNIAK